MDLTVTIGQYPLLFFSQGSIWHQVILVSWLTLKLSLPHNMVAMISSVSSEGNIGVIIFYYYGPPGVTYKQYILAFTSFSQLSL